MLSALSLVTRGFIVPTIVQTKNVAIGGVEVSQKVDIAKIRQTKPKVSVKQSTKTVRVKASSSSVKAKYKKPSISIHK